VCWVLVWSSLAIFLFLPFEMGIFILCQCMLEICKLLFWFWQRLTTELPWLSRKLWTWTFEQCWDY
jgi:hypothetical protein